MVFEDWTTKDGTQNFFYKNAVKTDHDGNVFVVGATINNGGNYDILTAKYGPKGEHLWTAQYAGAGGGQDIGTSLYIDNSGNVYITGTAATSAFNYDIVLIKYQSDGTQAWAQTYNSSGFNYDTGSDITMDGAGYIYVTGGSYNSSLTYDIVTLKYNSSGTLVWSLITDIYNFNDLGVRILPGDDSLVYVVVLD
jgi:hypothetical protein